MPRFLYFDFGEVLFHFSHPLAARQMAQVAGTDYKTVWNVVFAGDLELRFEAGCDEFSCRVGLIW